MTIAYFICTANNAVILDLLTVCPYSNKVPYVIIGKDFNIDLISYLSTGPIYLHVYVDPDSGFTKSKIKSIVDKYYNIHLVNFQWSQD